MLKILSNRSIQTILIIGLYIFCAPYLSLRTNEIFYTISIVIKDLLVWMMPLTVCIFIASTIGSFEKKAPLFILILILFEACSNFLCVFYGYGSGLLISSKLPTLHVVEMKENFHTVWHIPFEKPTWWGSDKGSLLGVIIGFISAFTQSRTIKNSLHTARVTIEKILTNGFARMIPIFVLGFVAQIYTTGLLHHMILYYSILIVYLVGFIAIYIFSIFLIGNGFKISGAISNLKNLLPAGIISFTSGCSLSTMPWTIQGTSLNLKDPELAKAVIPTTTNIQQVGDCIAQSFLCFIIYTNFYGYHPDIITWTIFTMVFVAVRFTTVAMIGGAIFLVLPIYQHYLNFTSEMIAIILAFNVILDPIITSGNVVANGGLAKIFEKIWDNFNKKGQEKRQEFY